MGLISAALGTVSGVLADQWKEYFYCEALPEDVLAVKGIKRTSGRSSNTKGTDNIISDGSVIAVADGQCMAIVEQGKVVDICAEPGEYTYDCSTEPSLFSGNLSSSIKEVFAQLGKRFTFGGQAPNDQRVYYFNTKELVGNKYGTASPVPFRIVDKNIGLDLDTAVKCFGEYSIRVTNPILFYTNVCGNFDGEYTRDRIESQMKTELLTALQPALAKISDMGIRYSAIPAHTKELAQALNDELSSEWRDRRGIEIVAFGISSMTLSEEDQDMIKQLQRAASLRDPSLGGGYMVGGTVDAMKDAANNPNGAVGAVMGVGMVQNMGNGTAQQLYQMGAQQQAQQSAQGGAFCPHCGKPVAPGSAFCSSCGKPLTAPGTWTCPKCGKVNDGAFCPGCGTAKP
ncbi:MAG: SPFH domain-containing protein [Oscillospiraceae bacterium]|nr:SPFH domain-containing protein [Oscillospiraceae bacterium]